MKTHKFARKPFYVDAVRVSEANIDAVAEWCEGTVETSEDETLYVKVKVNRPLTERQTQAFIGDWVLYAGTGFKVYTPKAFDKSFEKVKTLTKEQADEAGITVPHEKSSSKRPLFSAKPGAHVKGAGTKTTTETGMVVEDYRSAETGKFVSEEEAEANPDTTVKETTVTQKGSGVKATVPEDEVEVHRSAKSGEFVSEEEAEENPDTTVKETVKKSKADIEAEKLIDEVKALEEE